MIHTLQNKHPACRAMQGKKGPPAGKEWADGEEVRGGVEDGRLDLVEGVAEEVVGGFG